MDTQETTTFDLYWQIVKRRSIPALSVFFPVLLISLIASSLKKPLYQAEGKLQFQRTNTISSLTGFGTEIGKLEPLVEDKSSPIDTEAEVIRSLPVVKTTVDRLNLKDKKGKPLKPEEFLKKLTVTNISKTDILKISYKDTNPQITARVVNTVMAIYLNRNLLSHRAQASAARKFLEQQMPRAELIVKRVEADLRQFKEQNKIVALQEEATQAVEMMTDLQRQMSNTRSRISDINAQSLALRRQLGMEPEQAVAMTSLSQSSGVQDTLKEVQQLESQLAARRIVLQDTHPEIINLESRLEALQVILKKRIKQVAETTLANQNSNLQVGVLQQQLTAKLVELESTRQGLESELATLTGIEKSYRERQKNLPKLEQRQRELERRLQVAQSTYSLLQQKLQESRIAENQNLGNASVLSEANVPDEPISSMMISYLGAGLLALIAGLATIYILELQDKSIKTIDDAKRVLGLTLLGVIPSFGKSHISASSEQEIKLDMHQLVMRDIPRSPMSEAFRMLRANLKYIRADKELKVIVVTSSVPREGKSTVAANLAIAMAQMDRRVLLVDADLHRPVQHFIWGLHHNEGLSNVIVGHADIETAIKKVMNNLYVLTSGVLPPSPAALLDSQRMASLVDKFGTSYDFVIIDAPSLTVAADAASLGQLADGVLLVVRPGVVDSINATLAKEFLEKSGQKILGQVVNGIAPKKDLYSYYFYEEYYPQEATNTSKDEPVKTVK